MSKSGGRFALVSPTLNYGVTHPRLRDYASECTRPNEARQPGDVGNRREAAALPVKRDRQRNSEHVRLRGRDGTVSVASQFVTDDVPAAFGGV